MQRRTFLQTLLIALPMARTARAAAVPIPSRRVLLIQESPLAGFQYHEGEALWLLLRTGSPLKLIREAQNPHDPCAVAVRFMNRRIGYLPRVENAAVSQMLDRGERLSACIVTLRRDPDPWQRVRVAVELGLFA
jgi:hypothetical protein